MLIILNLSVIQFLENKVWSAVISTDSLEVDIPATPSQQAHRHPRSVVTNYLPFSKGWKFLPRKQFAYTIKFGISITSLPPSTSNMQVVMRRDILMSLRHDISLLTRQHVTTPHTTLTPLSMALYFNAFQTQNFSHNAVFQFYFILMQHVNFNTILLISNVALYLACVFLNMAYISTRHFIYWCCIPSLTLHAISNVAYISTRHFHFLTLHSIFNAAYHFQRGLHLTRYSCLWCGNLHFIFSAAYILKQHSIYWPASHL